MTARTTIPPKNIAESGAVGAPSSSNDRSQETHGRNRRADRRSTIGSRVRNNEPPAARPSLRGSAPEPAMKLEATPIWRRNVEALGDPGRSWARPGSAPSGETGGGRQRRPKRDRQPWILQPSRRGSIGRSTTSRPMSWKAAAPTPQGIQRAAGSSPKSSKSMGLKTNVFDGGPYQKFTRHRRLAPRQNERRRLLRPARGRGRRRRRGRWSTKLELGKDFNPLAMGEIEPARSADRVRRLRRARPR